MEGAQRRVWKSRKGVTSANESERNGERTSRVRRREPSLEQFTSRNAGRKAASQDQPARGITARPDLSSLTSKTFQARKHRLISPSLQKPPAPNLVPQTRQNALGQRKKAGIIFGLCQETQMLRNKVLHKVGPCFLAMPSVPRQETPWPRLSRTLSCFLLITCNTCRVSSRSNA